MGSPPYVAYVLSCIYSISTFEVAVIDKHYEFEERIKTFNRQARIIRLLDVHESTDLYGKQ
jgi:hypothetical protein